MTAGTLLVVSDAVEQAQSEVAAAEAQLAAAEANEAAANAAQDPPPVVETPVASPDVNADVSPESVARDRQADGTARPDGRQPSTIPEPRVASQDA